MVNQNKRNYIKKGLLIIGGLILFSKKTWGNIIMGDTTGQDVIIENDLTINGDSEFNGETEFNESVTFFEGIEIEGDIKHSDGSILSSGTSGSTPTSGAGTRLMWIPSKSAFRAGIVTGTQFDAVNIGNYSFATGHNNRAIGIGSFATGTTNYVTGDYGASFSYSNDVGGDYAVSFGRQNEANGYASLCFGYACNSDGSYSVCGGSGSESTGSYSFCLGYACEANGNGSFALGNNSIADDSYSIALGSICSAYASYAVAIGGNCTSQGYASQALGYTCKVLGNYSSARGINSYGRSTMDGIDVWASGKINEQGDAQKVFLITTTEIGAYDTEYINSPNFYSSPSDCSLMALINIVIRADDGACAFLQRRVHAHNDAGTLTIDSIQTIGTDEDDDFIIDELLIEASTADLSLELTTDYGDDVGVVASIEILENLYFKEST